MSAPAGVVTPTDVQAAQTVLDALQEVAADTTTATEYALKARGVLATWCSDVRFAGYLEGVQRGRREAAHVVLDALQGEGLAP